MSREPSPTIKPARENVLDTSASIASFSEFGAHLMTPIVTLYVGEERVKFLVHEGVLCELQFFQSVLKGSTEASERTINMPGDNPEAIAALIQHLQTGAYGGKYDSARTRQMRAKIRGISESQDDSLSKESPGAKDFAAALFALQVHVVADKYEYPDLILAAKERFQSRISSSKLTDLEILWVWKFAYAADLNFSILGMDSGSQRTDTIRTARSLLNNCPEEMRKIMSEFTDLAYDLLNMVFTEYKCDL